MEAHQFTTWFAEYFNHNVETYCSEKNLLSKYCTLKINWSPKSSDWKKTHKINVVYMPANTTFILHPMNKEVISKELFPEVGKENVNEKALLPPLVEENVSLPPVEEKVPRPQTKGKKGRKGKAVSPPKEAQPSIPSIEEQISLPSPPRTKRGKMATLPIEEQISLLSPIKNGKINTVDEVLPSSSRGTKSRDKIEAENIIETIKKISSERKGKVATSSIKNGKINTVDIVLSSSSRETQSRDKTEAKNVIETTKKSPSGRKGKAATPSIEEQISLPSPPSKARKGLQTDYVN